MELKSSLQEQVNLVLTLVWSSTQMHFSGFSTGRSIMCCIGAARIYPRNVANKAALGKESAVDAGQAVVAW
jgi:hypothetical protein